MPTVLVTDAGLGSAVSVIRSLGRKGMRVIAADSGPRSPGFWSRYAHASVRYPPPREAADATVDCLAQAVRAYGVDLVIPVTDDTILPLVAARDRFPETCQLALPDDEAWAAARDKRRTLELARRLDVPTPRSVFVETADEARREAAALGWPVVLKPQASRVFGDAGAIEALNVSYVGGFARLTERVRAFEGLCPMLLQEYYTGEAHGVELLLHEGRPLLAFQHKRLREVPITGGASSLRESVPLDPLLYEYAVRLLKELAWTGLAMVEFKIGRDGPRLMEINGRIWGSLPLAVKSGVDFPARLAELYLDGPTNGRPPETTYPIGVRSRHLELEAVWITSVLRKKRRYPFLTVPRRRDALQAAAHLLHPADGYDILDRHDPGPGVAEVLKILAKPFRRRRGGG